PAPAVVKIWEFSPYEVEIFYAFDSTVTVSAIAKQRFVQELEKQLERTFQAAWRGKLTEMSPRMSGQVMFHFDQLTLDHLIADDLTLVVSSKHPETKTLRTFEAALAGLPEIVTAAASQRAVEAAVAK